MTWVLGIAPVPLLTAPLPLPGQVCRRRGGSLGAALQAALELSLVKDAENKTLNMKY